MPKRVLVIGAGPGGLAAAMLLARRGAEVTLLERLPAVGGRTRTFELPAPVSAGRSDAAGRGAAGGSFRFDLGPTFFLYPEVLAKIFGELGRDLAREVDLVRLDPQYRLVFGAGGELRCSPQVERMREEIARLAPADALRLDAFLADNRRKLAAFKPCLESPFLGWRDLLKARLLKLLPMIAPWRSLEAETGRYFQDERVKLGFTFQSKYLGMSPFRCPSLFSILSFIEYEYGVFHPIGGCGAVTEAMARVARDAGVDIRLDEPVEELLFEGRRVRGARTARGTYEADAVVVNADFARAMQRLVPDRLRRRWTDRKLAKKSFSCSTYMLYLGLEGRQDHAAHHSIFIPAGYRENLEDIERRGRLSDDPSFYVQNPCVTDPTLAPDGMSTLYVLVPVPNRTFPIDWREEGPKLRAKVLRHLERVGIEDVERRIRAERVLTPQGWDEDHEVHLGATFSLAHSLDQMLHLRPRNRFDDIDGMYLVGGGTHPGSGLPVIFESARISAKLLGEDLGLPEAPPAVDALACELAGEGARAASALVGAA